MGSQIAAHLANAQLEVLLLDIVPGELTAEESARGLSLSSRQVRNRIAPGILLGSKSESDNIREFRR
jgi:3-hydroxyacyl-CoA dehydrogenase